jgi:hypothetical protein
MGAAVFCTDDDILAVRPKMIMMFLASVMLVDQRLNTERGTGDEVRGDCSIVIYGCEGTTFTLGACPLMAFPRLAKKRIRRLPKSTCLCVLALMLAMEWNFIS